MTAEDELDQTKFEFDDPTGKENESLADETDTTPDDDSNDFDLEEPEDFQSALDRLKNVAGRLESGELPLEEAMERYREGIELIEFCEDRLEEAELLVEEIDDDLEGAPEIQSKEPPES